MPVCRAAAARTTPSAISLRANSDSYSYTLASLTVPANLGVLANDNYTDTCTANTARATLLAVPVRGSVALDTDGGFVYTVTNPTPLGRPVHCPACRAGLVCRAVVFASAGVAALIV